MIQLPNFKKAFDHENNFYLSCATSRLGKFAAHYELFKMANDLEGDIVECGVFKGASLFRFAAFQELFGKKRRKIIGFDTFGKFPDTNFKSDKAHRKRFIKDAGSSSISKTQLLALTKHKKLKTKVELVAGDIIKTVPLYLASHPKLKIALLNLDTDIYEPAVTILKYLWPRLQKGGVLILDDYGVFPGETKAVDDFFRGKKICIQKFAKLKTPSFIIK